MSIESPEETTSIELGKEWTATAKRYAEKINEEIERIGDDNPRVPLLQKLEATINDSFLTYQTKGFNIKQVEEDMRHRRDRAESDEETAIYKQILSFLNVSNVMHI